MSYVISGTEEGSVEAYQRHVLLGSESPTKPDKQPPPLVTFNAYCAL